MRSSADSDVNGRHIVNGSKTVMMDRLVIMDVGLLNVGRKLFDVIGCGATEDGSLGREPRECSNREC